ncbi:NUCLEOSIDE TRIPHOSPHATE HYDROLASE SUPERFAMILY PROTEIN putative-RELATED [Salix purpurea]|uniref:NUCLEOSIDE TRIPHOSPHATE HYDROLASE SUPERFAMILY PROTEIN putative-RELATED n=1 Tax=Salix purpurea TaxID=77065 RepID=A0A9Q0WHH8_SALPP|nr:NUCLEOSIDE TRIPHOSPHATE HYDROLASE SUPERFAMILY PROTEIN putative-RELATED [Salix purpurea]
MWTELGATISSLAVAFFMLDKYSHCVPYILRGYLARNFRKLVNFVNPYVEITFLEYTGERLKRSDAFLAIQNYLSTSSTQNARKLMADVANDSQSVVLSMQEHEEVTDVFNGVNVWWASGKILPQSKTISFSHITEEKRYYKLTFDKHYREIITKSYLQHVLKEGKEIKEKNRQRMLYTNTPSKDWQGWRPTKWGNIVFEHPSTFDTLAMETQKKDEIKKDLIKFSKGKDYYAKIGKAWKRGYLLYGPPGTGKSSMIAAMANLLDYDVYDIELTTIKDNSELRKLLIDTKGRSIIVIEDIDCSLDLTGQRKKRKEKDDDEADKEKDPILKLKKEAEKEGESGSKVTLSGLLNVIDGIWSACGGERIIIFTTNYVDKLDPALIRTGRMDKHIEMSYCCFDAFKVLAKNYLDIESHELFGKIEEVFAGTKMSPAYVADMLMPKSEEQDGETCLKNLIAGLEASKEEAGKKSEEAAMLEAEDGVATEG